jgi:hypothetical protein
MIFRLSLIGLALILAGCAVDFSDSPHGPSLLSLPSWCDVAKGELIGETICMKQTYTESGGIVITVNRSVVTVPVRLEFVDHIEP